MAKRSLVIIPTYNEIENIPTLVPDILSIYDSNLDILVVDDNSPDGTAAWVKEYMQKSDRVHILERPGKMGLGTAYCDGFRFGLEKGYDYIFEMDADFSHDPRELFNFLMKIQDYDLVLGSRYIKGVNVINWPMRRLLLSYFANIYTKVITGLPVKDATGGFKCFRREVLEAIDLDRVKSNGYAFQIEMTFKAYKKGFRIAEIPIIFNDRTAGHSKMSKAIVREAVFMVWKLRLRSIFNRL